MRPLILLTFLTLPAAHADDTRLAGSWRLIACDNILPDGSRIALYGDHPQGLFVIDAAGRYSMQIMRAERPRFASGDKSRGSAEEYRAAALGSNAHYGSIDAAAGELVFRIAYATFPNWDGSVRKSSYTLEGKRLVYRVAAPTSGAGATGEVVWEKMD